MRTSIPDIIREMVEASTGEVVKKFKAAPLIKPPRRKPSLKNKSERDDYMKNYMQDYRGEKGKDYQKTPDAIKELRRKQKESLKKTLKLKDS